MFDHELGFCEWVPSFQLIKGRGASSCCLEMQSVCLYQSVVFLPTGVQWPSAWSHGVPPTGDENHWHPSGSTTALPEAAGHLLFCLPWGCSQPIWAQFGVSGHHSTVWDELPSQYCVGWIAITVLFGVSCCHCIVWDELPSQYCLAITVLFGVSSHQYHLGWVAITVLFGGVAITVLFGVSCHHILFGASCHQNIIWGELPSQYCLGWVAITYCLEWVAITCCLGWVAIRASFGASCYYSTAWGELPSQYYLGWVTIT